MLGDDLLVCVLGGVYTDVEKTMIELQRSTSCRAHAADGGRRRGVGFTREGIVVGSAPTAGSGARLPRCRAPKLLLKA
jgi:hypothetical protein